MAVSAGQWAAGLVKVEGLGRGREGARAKGQGRGRGGLKKGKRCLKDT